MATPVPKDPDQRRRRNRPPEFDELPAAGYAGEYPPLPGAYRMVADDDGTSLMVDYLPETRRWYDVLATSPMATKFTAFDWLRLQQQVAPLVDRFHRHPSQTLSAELRLLQASFGGSPTDRQKMRWRIVEPDDAPSAPAARKRRDPRLRVVGDGEA